MIALLARKLPQSFVLCMEDADLQTFTNYSLSSGKTVKRKRKGNGEHFQFVVHFYQFEHHLGIFLFYKDGIFHSNVLATKARRFLVPHCETIFF